MMKNKTIFEYSNFKHPYLKITSFDKNGMIENELCITLSKHELEDGAILDVNGIAGRIKENFGRLYPIDLVLSCEEIYKSVYSLPKMSMMKAKGLYKKELKEFQKTNYSVITDYYTHSVGYIFNSYFVPNNILHQMEKLAKRLNATIVSVQLFGMYLKDKLNYKEDYAYIYAKDNLCRMLLVVDNELVTEYDFSFDDVFEIKHQFMLVLSKHEFEFERRPITQYGIDSDIPIDLGVNLKRIDLGENSLELMDEIEIEYDEPQETMINDKSSTFYERYQSAQDFVKKRYEKLANYILSYSEMEYKITEVCAVFYIKSKVWFKIDIDRKGNGKRISLYLAEEPIKLYKQKVQFAISKKQNFLSTPCLFRFSTGVRFRMACRLVSQLMNDNGVSLLKLDKTNKENEKK